MPGETKLTKWFLRSFVEVSRFKRAACASIQRPFAELFIESFHLLSELGVILSLTGCLSNPPAHCDRVLFK